MSSVEEIVGRADALYHDLEFGSVKRWREAHGGAKAVGYLPIWVPRELIDAAGMLPVGLMGGRGLIEIIRGDAWFQSYICQIPRSTIELALTGRIDAIDGFLFPSICDVIRNLSGMWKVMFPQKYVRYVDVPQNYDSAVGGRFFEGELRHLWNDLKKLSGTDPGDDAIKAAAVAPFVGLVTGQLAKRVASEASVFALAGVRDVTEVALGWTAGTVMPTNLDPGARNRPVFDTSRVEVVRG